MSASGEKVQVIVMSNRIFLPVELTSRVEHNKWNTEFQSLYEKLYYPNSDFTKGSSEPGDKRSEKEKGKDERNR